VEESMDLTRRSRTRRAGSAMVSALILDHHSGNLVAGK
jgi:hypothetical protein